MRRLGEVIKLSTEYLGRHGSGTPRLDAELLIGHALSLSRVDLYVHHDRPLEEPELAAVRELLERRRAHEPVAYILGEWGFRGLTLRLDRRVLVPRPETEELAGACLELLDGRERPRVLDVGTGSGAIALALKDERPDLEVWATEVSPPALEVARGNAQRLGLEVRFAEADLLTGIDESFDAVLANLPYVERGAELAPEITRYEPREALFAGPDGLEVIRRLVKQLGSVLLVALEVGAGQASEVSELLLAAGFGSVESLADLAGHHRVVVGRR